MIKYENFSDVWAFSKYRIDILSGKYKGVYMYDLKHEENQMLLQFGKDIEDGTKIFFFERITNKIDGKALYDIYDIIIKTADEILPKKTLDVLGQFAEIQNVAQGQKAMFKANTGKMRAKKFLTQVGLS